MIAVMWQFQVKDGGQDAFEQFYGADGEWAAMGRKSRSFLGTSFLRDQIDPTRYVLIEYWSEMVVYERHQADFADEMTSLKIHRDLLCVTIVPLGVFTALDVPNRFGPTWSQRDGL
jgi:heme-degrading monooxygenase HmoA